MSYLLPLFFNSNTMKERIRDLMLKNGAFTPQDKKDIKAMIAESGIDFTFKTRCPDCYTDALTLLALHYDVRTASFGHVTECGRYIAIKRGRCSLPNGISFEISCNTPAHLIDELEKAFPQTFSTYYQKVEKTEE